MWSYVRIAEVEMEKKRVSRPHEGVFAIGA
jgi:hypothetical protein